MPNNIFGIPYFYPSKAGGFKYEQSNNILSDSHFNGQGDVTNVSAGGGGNGSNWDCCKVAPSSNIVYDTDKVLCVYEGWNGVQEHIRHWRIGFARGQLDGSDQINQLFRDAGNPYIGLSLTGSGRFSYKSVT